jgi:hypothetical protein
VALRFIRQSTGIEWKNANIEIVGPISIDCENVFVVVREVEIRLGRKRENVFFYSVTLYPKNLMNPRGEFVLFPEGITMECNFSRRSSKILFTQREITHKAGSPF